MNVAWPSKHHDLRIANRIMLTHTQQHGGVLDIETDYQLNADNKICQITIPKWVYEVAKKLKDTHGEMEYAKIFDLVIHNISDQLLTEGMRPSEVRKFRMMSQYILIAENTIH